MNVRPTPASTAIALALALLAATPCVAEDDDVDTPTGGWRMGDPDVADYMQDVRYPAVSVNAGGKRNDALVAGRIAARSKATGDDANLFTLVINGNPLPMPVHGDRYARPYAFGTGSNGIEVRDASGNVLRRTQFLEVNPAKVPARLRVILAWDSNHTDVDLHVVAPDGEHTWYGERVTQSGALDVDVTDGYGPEIFSGLAPPEGTWLVYANYYGGYDDEQPLTTATVTVVQNENTAGEKRETFTVPLRKPGDLNFVTRFIHQH